MKDRAIDPTASPLMGNGGDHKDLDDILKRLDILERRMTRLVEAMRAHPASHDAGGV